MPNGSRFFVVAVVATPNIHTLKSIVKTTSALVRWGRITITNDKRFQVEGSVYPGCSRNLLRELHHIRPAETELSCYNLH